MTTVTGTPSTTASWRARGLAALALALLASAGCAHREAATTAAWDPDSIPDAYVRPGGALMWPGAARAWYVTPEGHLYNGDWEVRLTPASGGVPAGPPRRIAAEERWRPVLRWTRTRGSVHFGFEAVALPGVAPRDTGLVASLEIVAQNRGPAAADAEVDVALAIPDAVPLFAAFDAPEPPEVPHWGGSGALAPVQAWCRNPAQGAKLHAQWTLAPGASERLRIVLPVYPEPERALAAWARTSHAECVARAHRYWNAALAEGASFELGDPEVERALRAAVVVLLACRERRGAEWVPIGGPFQYRDVWLRDGARVIQALTVTGHVRDARALASGLLGLQWPQGAFLSQRGQLDGTGQALWAFEQAFARGSAGDARARFADAAERAWRWSEWMRGMGREAGWRFATLMPYAEPRDNELTRAQLVGNDAWMLAGYRAAETLLRLAGRGALADSVAASRAAYLADFRAALDGCGSPDVPPSWQGVGRDWGNLTVAYPCRVLTPGDPRVVALARRVWRTSGGAGLLSYGARDSLQYYYGADLASWALVQGLRGEADSVLDAMLHWRTASGGAGELFSRAGDYGSNLPPHATSAAALATLLRQCLIFDDADTLMLTLGARSQWWRGARVRGAPTRWGSLDVAFRRAGDHAEWSWTAVPVWTLLALPPGTRLAHDPPPPLVRASDTRLLAPPGTRAARVELEPEPRGAS